MRSGARTPPSREIVLLGGGHAHVQVVRDLGRHPPAGARITLVTDRLAAPYSGMLPGCVSGDFTPEEMHIDLARLTAACAVRLLWAEATGIDLAARRLLLAGRPPLPFDILSINVGIVPDLAAIAGAADFAIPVKPIAGFLERFDELARAVSQPGGPRRVAVAGGGAAGFELAIAASERLRRVAPSGEHVEVSLCSAGRLLAGMNDRVRAAARRALDRAGVLLRENCRVAAVDGSSITASDGRRFPADALLASTEARVPDWLARTELPRSGDGGVAIDRTLAVQGLHGVFAAGDCATVIDDPRPRAGVFAVRQGPVLADNLRRVAEGRALREHRAQRLFLTLLRTGQQEAIAGRGGLVKAEGRWVRRWKDRIDRRFMAIFDPDGDLMAANAPMAEDDGGSMRCGGCAAKVGPSALASALARLPSAGGGGQPTIGLSAPDDAALVELGSGLRQLLSVDLFRAFLDDPWLTGRIAAVHALSDIHAMGGTPAHALAIAVLPHGDSRWQEETLFQLLAGMRSALDAEDVPLVGGHSAEGAEVMLGLAVTGQPGAAPLTRRGARPDDALVLTKAIGTGIVLAAHMRAGASAASLSAALAAMQVSNAAAARLLAAGGVRALTDVTGFGLAGHLLEMLDDGVDAIVDLAAVPLLPGVLTLARVGVASTLLPASRPLLARAQAGRALEAAEEALLLDPQTAGGLLAAVPAARADELVAALRGLGLPAAAIGRFAQGTGRLRLENSFGPSPDAPPPAISRPPRNRS